MCIRDRLSVAAGLALVVGGCGGGRPAPPPSAATLVGAGNAAIRQGDYNAATQLFQQAIQRDPSNATAYYDLGTVFQSERRNSDALAQYAKALAYDPKMVPAIFNQATIYAVHNAPLAIFLYQRIISLQPHAPTAYLNRGLLEDAQGDKSRAGADLRMALAQDPTLRSRIPAAAASDLTLRPPSPRSGTPTTAPSS
jgi:tetratricopeptide (TPR) repeat protein